MLKFSSRKPVVLLNALATRSGGAFARAQEIAKRAGRSWNADVFVLRSPEASIAVADRADLKVLPPLAHLPLTVRRLFEGEIVRTAARRVGADVVIHHGIYVPTRLPQEVKNVLYFVSLSPWGPGNDAQRIRNRLRRKLFEWTVDRAAGIIVQSQAARAQLTAIYPHLAPRVHAVHNGCAIPSVIRPAKCVDFVLIGDIHRYRRVHDVVRAYATLPSAIRDLHRLIIAGHLAHDPAGVRLLRHVINETGVTDRVVFTGSVPRDRVVSLLASACGFVSFAEIENGPNTIVEALAVETPCIVSDLPVHREFANSTALYVASVSELAEAMARVAQMADGRGIERIIPAKDTWDAQVRKLGEVLARLHVRGFDTDVIASDTRFAEAQ